MAKSQQTDGTSEPAPDFLTHLEQAFGWSETQAIEALGAYILSTEAGRRLRREVETLNRAPSAA
jgi:hypothetical protein